MATPKSETPVERQVRLVLEKQARDVGTQIKEALPAGVGFALFVFDFATPDGPNNLAYISNGKRSDIVKMLDEWKAKTS